MAYRRSICCRATIFARRFNPSYSYIPHTDDDNTNTNVGKIDQLLTQKRSVFEQHRLFLGVIGNGFGGHRFMSTAVADVGDKTKYLSQVTDAAPLELISSQASVLSEVDIAAADSFFPVAGLQFLIDNVHSFTGFNWAASIVLTTILIRGATVPLLINLLKATSKLSNMKPHLDKIQAEMLAKGNDREATLEGKVKMDALFKQYGVTPFTPLKGMFIQGPLFLCFFLAISNMVEKVPSFKNGGAYWFMDLSTPDATYILPVLTALTFLLNVEFIMQEGLKGNPMASIMKNVSRGFAVLTVPLTMNFPTAIFFYWVTSNTFTLAYGLVMKIPGVKEALGVPKIVTPPPTTKPISFQEGFSMFKALKQAAASGSSPAVPAASGQSKPAVYGKTPSLSSSSAVLSQRLKILERQVMRRKNNKKR